MPAKLKGVRKTNFALEKRINEIADKKLPRALFAAATTASPYVDIRTPVLTSNLINSRTIPNPEKNNEGWAVYIRYTANYADLVHDPKVKQTFTKPSATKEFLTLGVEDAYPEMTRTFRNFMKL